MNDVILFSVELKQTLRTTKAKSWAITGGSDSQGCIRGDRKMDRVWTGEMQVKLTPLLQRLNETIKSRDGTSLAKFFKWEAVPQPQQQDIASALAPVLYSSLVLFLFLTGIKDCACASRR